MSEISVESLPLWNHEMPAASAECAFRPSLDIYRLDPKIPKGAVLIFPGGGYQGRAQHEGVDVARAVNAQGLNAFVCQYRVSPNRHPAMLLDAARAIRMIRQHAKPWGVDADKIAILGFSAGGHLAATLSNLFEETKAAGLNEFSARPDAAILCYAVLSAGRFAHQGSFKNLLGPDAPASLRETLSMEKRIGPHTPPTFLWSTANDPGVAVENSLLYALQLRAFQIPFEMHIYPKGNHGLGLAPAHHDIAEWFPCAMRWLKGMGWEKAHNK